MSQTQRQKLTSSRSSWIKKATTTKIQHDMSKEWVWLRLQSEWSKRERRNNDTTTDSTFQFCASWNEFTLISSRKKKQQQHFYLHSKIDSMQTWNQFFPILFRFVPFTFHTLSLCLSLRRLPYSKTIDNCFHSILSFSLSLPLKCRVSVHMNIQLDR